LIEKKLNIRAVEMVPSFRFLLSVIILSDLRLVKVDQDLPSLLPRDHIVNEVVEAILLDQEILPLVVWHILNLERQVSEVKLPDISLDSFLLLLLLFCNLHRDIERLDNLLGLNLSSR